MAATQVSQERSSLPQQAVLYVIVGSHACRTATMMLEHKRVPYRLVELPSGLHPVLVRAHGFPGRTQPRTFDGGTPPLLALLDRLGTVPALRIGTDRVQTNLEIARYLERQHPEAPLFPADRGSRLAVEEAEQWGDQTLQMSARRVALAANLDSMHMRGADGRLGPLLARKKWQRTVLSHVAGRPFAADGKAESTLLEAIPPLLDRIDSWIVDGVLNSSRLNAADFTIAPSLALLSYHRRLAEEISARPAGALLERLLPQPSA